MDINRLPCLLIQVIAHADDQTVGGLEGSVSKMLQADPDFRKNLFFMF